MTNFVLLVPLVAFAISLSSAHSIRPYSVSWNQTREHPSSHSGKLGSSIQGHFPAMSPRQIGLGCGIDWENGQLHAGFDCGDTVSGVGSGFEWRPHSLSGNIGLHYNGPKINLNLTITDTNQVLFNVNGKELDWQKVLNAELKPEGKDAGPDQYPIKHVN